MHPNPTFRGAAAETNLAFAAKRGFGLLSVNGAEGPLAAHVPFVCAKDGAVEMHLVRSNPIARTEGPIPALLAVQGPDAYISPDWYGAADQVPTWNYIAVHLRGALITMPSDALEPHLHAVSDRFEATLLPKLNKRRKIRAASKKSSSPPSAAARTSATSPSPSRR